MEVERELYTAGIPFTDRQRHQVLYSAVQRLLWELTALATTKFSLMQTWCRL